MSIERGRYLKRLIARKHDGFVKVITGLRRCGKSYLLFNLFQSAYGMDEPGKAEQEKMSLKIKWGLLSEDCR